MNKSINLDELLRALHNSVLEAQKLTEQQHIRQLHNYFDWPKEEEVEKSDQKLLDLIDSGIGVARTCTIRVPDLRPRDENGSVKAGEGVEEQSGEYEEGTMLVEVPLMSLIPPSAIKIKKMVVDFKVGLRGFEKTRDEIKSRRFTKGDRKSHKGPVMIDLGGISGGIFSKQMTTANVKIEFETGDPSESFLRINDQLIKSIV